VNNEANACLDEVALNAQSDAVLVLVGNNGETPRNTSKDLAAQRALNTKEYLTQEKGIDPSRIQLWEGRSNSATVNNYLVLTGADFDRDIPGTSVLDETLLSPEGKR
jgi:hypothetical protein